MKKLNISNTTDELGRTLNFSLSKVEILPKFIEKPGTKWVSYGKSNTYPLMLVELMNSSALHGAIVRSISEQVAGQSIKIKDGKDNPQLQAFIDNCNRSNESLHEVVTKCSLDHTVFGGLSLSTVWNKGQTFFDLYHTDWSTLRCSPFDITGKISKYYFSNNWKKTNPSITEYPVFDSQNKTSTQIYTSNFYSPGQTYYPLPSYVHVIDWILINYKISQFHNSQLDSGFFPSVIIERNKPFPGAEKANEEHEQFKEQFEGSSNAGKVLDIYGENAAKVHNLSKNDSDKMFLDLESIVLQEILSGWRITSSELVGIKEAGRLGDNNFIEASELFNSTVIKPRRQSIEKNINFLLKSLGFTDEIYIEETRPVAFGLEPKYMMMIATTNEIRSWLSLPAIEGGDKIVERGKTPDKPETDTNTTNEK